MDSFEILKVAANALNNRKATELTGIKIEDVSDIADYFLICTATSNTHVRALSEAVEEKLGEAGVKPDHIAGKSSDWLLLDYGTVVIHIFGRKSRDYYSLDRMWSDGETVDLSNVLEKGTEE